MTALSTTLCVLGVLVIVALAYWQLVIAEGTYLGPRVVALMYDWISRRYDSIKRFVREDERWFIAGPLHLEMKGLRQPLVLDVATGTGRVPVALLDNRFLGHRYSGQVIGLDFSLGMLRQARSKLDLRGGQVALLWQDASRLPFDDGTFDAVACLEALEFLPRPLDALAEMVRVMAPNGMLLLTNRVGREAFLLPRRSVPRERFASVLSAYGLEEVRVRRWQTSYDLATARKPGRGSNNGHGGVPLADLVRCPQCGSRLLKGAADLSCRACARAYPIRDGIVWLARPQALQL